MEKKEFFTLEENHLALDLLLGKGDYEHGDRTKRKEELIELFGLKSDYDKENLSHLFEFINEAEDVKIAEYAARKPILKGGRLLEEPTTSEEKWARRKEFEEGEQAFQATVGKAKVLLDQHASFIDKEDYMDWQSEILENLLMVFDAPTPESRKQEEHWFENDVLYPSKALAYYKEGNKKEADEYVKMCITMDEEFLETMYESMPIGTNLLIRFAGKDALDVMKTSYAYRHLDLETRKRFDKFAEATLEKRPNRGR